MTDDSTDVLVISYRSPERTKISLRRLLEVADPAVRVWIWQNGNHPETLEVVKSMADHPRVAHFRHSEENVRLGPPTQWLFTEGKGTYLSKIDDDAVVPVGWPRPLIDAHDAEPRFGVLGSWRFLAEDEEPDLAALKTQTFAGGQRIMRNLWVEGTTYLMKRACVERHGVLGDDQTFTNYCHELGQAGWINGYLVPFVRYGNLDDPRAADTLIRTDSDLIERLPLSAKVNGVSTVEAWTAQIRRSAHIVQTAPFEPKHYRGWRQAVRRGRRAARRLGGDRRSW